MRDEIYEAVLELIDAVASDGFEAVRDRIAALPDRMEADPEPCPEPWQAALIEGIADAVRYAEAVRAGRAHLQVRFKPGTSVTWEWERGAKVEGEFRDTVTRAISSLLDGDKGIGDAR